MTPIILAKIGIWQHMSQKLCFMLSYYHDGLNADVAGCQRNPDVDFEIELTQCSKMALCRRLRALLVLVHTLAAHGTSGRVLEFNPLDNVEAFKVKLKTSGKS